MKVKVLSGLVILALALAAPAYPAETPKPIADTYTIDGITYYNVNSSNFNSDKRFYVDVVSAKHSALGDRSLGDLWLMAAIGLGLPIVNTVSFYNSSDYPYAFKQALLTGELPGNSRYHYSYTYSAPEWVRYDGGYVETSITFENAGLYSDVRYRVRFSDFTVGALLPADEGLYVSTTTENGNKDKEKVEASSVKNDTSTTVTTNQTITKSTTETLTSTVNHSSSYSFTEGIKFGFEYGFSKAFKVNGEISASFMQAYSDGWSKSEGVSKSYQKSSNVSVTLPAYTNVMLKQGEATTTTTTKYNCPVIVGYKVTVLIEQSILMGNGYYT